MAARGVGTAVFIFFFAMSLIIWATGIAPLELWHGFCWSVFYAGIASAFANYIEYRERETARRRRDERERNEELVALRERCK